MKQSSGFHQALRQARMQIALILIGITGLAMSFLQVQDWEFIVTAFVALAFISIGPGILGSLGSDDDGWYDGLLGVIACGALALSVLASAFDPSAIGFAVWTPIIVCGVPIIAGAVKGVLFERDITADLLVSIAIIAAIFIGELEAATEIAIIMQVGSLLEEATVGHAKSCLARLHDLTPSQGRVIRDGRILSLPVESITPGTVVRVLPGERIPVDGTVISGETSVDTSAITGESVPRDVCVGTAVQSGTVNLYGSIDIEVTRTSGDSTISRMARLIEEADAGRSKIVRTADKWASVIVVLALGISIATYALTVDAVRAVTVLVVFCPCALVLATPTAIMAAIAVMGRHGILVRDGGAIERLASVDTVLIDKTGTLTTGNMTCTEFISFDSTMGPGKLGRIAASVEARSEHPLGKAIYAAVEDAPEAKGFEYVPGRGVSAVVEGMRIFVGNRRFVEGYCPTGFADADAVANARESEGYLAVFIGCGNRTVGLAILSDTLRDRSKYAVRHLWMVGMKSIMVTGDSRLVATRMSDELGMDDVVWECLPEDKLHVVSGMDGDGGVCMIGDGVNDAPSLKRASVGIAMGGVGNDIAVESADVVFLENDLSKLPGLIRLSRRTLATIRAGIGLSIAINLTATVLAAMGLIGPIAGALVHNIGSVAVILGAVLILGFNPWKPTHRHRSTVSTSESA